MSRITDPTKIERIKKAAMDLIVEKGYGGASIGAIARKAGVSTGYLYRYYNSKEELVDDLIESIARGLNNMFLIDESITAKEIIHQFISKLFNLAKERPVFSKFACTLIFDRKFIGEQRENVKHRPIFDFMEGLIRVGIKTGEINAKTSIRDVLTVMFSIPFSYILHSLSNNFYKEDFTEEKIQRISEICLNALK